MNRLIQIFASLRLTVWLLLASLLLVFFGTLDQVELGVRGAQIKYFESLVATWGYPQSWPLGQWLHVVYLPIPGGYLLGPLLVLNLFTAHFRHFKARWSAGGIVLIHVGVLMLIFSQLFTQLFQKEYYIWFDEGESIQHLTSFHQDELVIIDTTDPETDTVYAIPARDLQDSIADSAPGLPLTVETIAFYENANILQGTQLGGAHPMANRGLAVTRKLSAHPMPPTFKSNERNGAAAYVRIRSGTEELGTWLVSTLLVDNMPAQTFSHGGRNYVITLRFAQQPLAYKMTLLDFAHDRYPGTNIPNNFSSHVRIDQQATGESREVLISMNQPLRFDGYTFYQSAFRKDAMGREDRASRLQVVRNPGWLGPYIACTLISIGLIWQFSWGLLKFSNRRKAKAALLTPDSPRPIKQPKAKKIISYALVALLVICTASILSKPFKTDAQNDRLAKELDYAALGQLPVLDGGRLKPLDTLARNFLILARAKQTALNADDQRVPAIEFLAQLLFDSQAAAQYKVFRIDNPDLLDLLEQPNTETTHLSYETLKPRLRIIDAQAKLVPEEAPERSPYHTALVKLYRAIQRYQSLEFGFLPFVNHSYDALLDMLKDGENPAMAALLRQQMSNSGLLLIPKQAPQGEGNEENEWISPAMAMLVTSVQAEPDPMLRAYFGLADAWRADDSAAYLEAIKELKTSADSRMDGGMTRPHLEFVFNRIQPFYLSLELYLIAFIATALYWLLGVPSLARTGVTVGVIALIIHTFGLIARVYLSGYAPVTNLYSSSVFVGWIAVLLAMPFERLFRNGLAIAAASLTGFTTLIIAHNLALSGGADTMEMMRAVLDSNFWLSTHVTTITIGYATTFLAGALALLYVTLHLSPRGPDKETIRSLKRMVYGMICFALLFSFIGTILGGIWADQSWGRFWGWDPKENGALMIVLWNALILHGLRTSMFSTRALMSLAIAGNIVTSWSWFGTNMLGVGLHSYGFMDKAFLWLMAFWISQLILIAVGWFLARKTETVSP